LILTIIKIIKRTIKRSLLKPALKKTPTLKIL